METGCACLADFMIDRLRVFGERVKETPFFFGRGNARLFGVLHEPVAATDTRAAFVMSHPFAEEKLWSHRVFVSFARALAERGCAVLRFDYSGAGDSSGSTAEASMNSHLADLDAAVRVLCEKLPTLKSIGLAGLRLGAAFAALFAERAASGDSCSMVREAPLILWDPTLDGDGYFQELLRSNLSTQLAVYGKVIESREVLVQRILRGEPVNIDGYEIGKPMFESCALKNLLSPESKQHLGPTLVVQVASNDKAKDRDDLVNLSRSYARGEFAKVIEQPFWREIKPFYARAENLQGVTLRWLETINV